MEQDNLQVKVERVGPDEATVAAALQSVREHHEVQRYLTNTRYRLLSFNLAEPVESKDEKSATSPPSHYRATFYDYTNSRTIYADGEFGHPDSIAVAESSTQPLPNYEEYEEALGILTKDPTLGPLMERRNFETYAAMPPVVGAELPDGRFERIITVGMQPRAGGTGRHEIVGVNLTHGSVVRFEGGAPGNASANAGVCGIPTASHQTAKNIQGQVWVTVTQGGATLWKFLAVRPAATAGPGLSTNGTGIELRYVDYRGKRVLYKAHVPVLNVKYHGDACGPYRDWQDQEGMIQAVGADVAPGFRLCSAPATTIIDSGSDAGNFLGVAIYVVGQEVVLVSKMEAGWYRYVSEWRLHADGTIRPRFGFTAVSNSCVCNVHYHHVYWRLDFDIATPGNNLVREYNDPCLPGICPSHWHDKNFEIRRPRDPARNRKWRIENTQTGHGYDIIPGHKDGVATLMPDWPYGRGDVWILRYHANEIDDGVVAIGPPYEAPMDTWVNGESTRNQDVVIWYAGHFIHDVKNEPPGPPFGDVLGPELRPFQW